MKSVDQGADPRATSAFRVRYDKWLWAARFYKTRSLAAQAIDAGQARPTIRQIFALDQAAQAHALCETGHGRGRIVLHIAG